MDSFNFFIIPPMHKCTLLTEVVEVKTGRSFSDTDAMLRGEWWVSVVCVLLQFITPLGQIIKLLPIVGLEKCVSR